MHFKKNLGVWILLLYPWKCTRVCVIASVRAVPGVCLNPQRGRPSPPACVCGPAVTPPVCGRSASETLSFTELHDLSASTPPRAHSLKLFCRLDLINREDWSEAENKTLQFMSTS